MNLYLDDVRQPLGSYSLMRYRCSNPEIYQRGDWHIVRNYQQFCTFVELNSEKIKLVSFDHDLANDHYGIDFDDWNNHTSAEMGLEETGYDAALFLLKFYNEKGLEVPEILVHSQNPVGTKKINDLFNYGK